ncbi:MAG: hypothetical protein WCJ57_00040 [Candidatus Falkowbacteria bacterium]
MNLSLVKKICLVSASIVWCLSPYVAMAVDAQGQEQALISPITTIIETKDLVEPQYKVVSVSTHSITAYTSEVAQCDASPCITANGFNVCKNNEENVIAANFLPFGTKVRIPELFGDRIFIVQDRMNRRFPTHVDVWMKNKKDAIKFGTKPAKIEVVVENVL